MLDGDEERRTGDPAATTGVTIRVRNSVLSGCPLSLHAEETLDVPEYVGRAVLTFAYLADNPNQLIPMKRLASSPIAAAAWRDLQQKKALDEEITFRMVVGDIGRNALTANLGRHQRRGKAEIRSAATRAQALANELFTLIQENGSLRFLNCDLYLEHERIALDRLTRGICFSGHKFQPEVEQQLDDLQQRDFGKTMSTSLAYRIIEYQLGMSDAAFAARLKIFAKLAGESADNQPAVPHPKRESASAQYFANITCELLSYTYGSPLLEIVTWSHGGGL